VKRSSEPCQKGALLLWQTVEFAQQNEAANKAFEEKKIFNGA